MARRRADFAPAVVQGTHAPDRAHPGPHGGVKTAGQAAQRHRRTADDRPCAAPGGSRRHRPGRRGRGRRGDLLGRRARGRPRGPDRPRASLRLRPHPGRARLARSRSPPRRGGQPAGRHPLPRSRLVGACAGLLDEEPAVRHRDAHRARGSPAERIRSRLPEGHRRDGRPAAPARALYFTRSTLFGDGPVWRHIGVYAYRRDALDRFAAAPPSPLETAREARAAPGAGAWALDLGGGGRAMPIEVNTPAELALARRHAEQAA